MDWSRSSAGRCLGLVGADEPRYAQVAREMLARNDFVTPILYGQPWLEKPALYYWRAMFAFREFGIHDWSARIPSASFAFTLIVLVYLHMRRFRPGGQLDAALITASCAGIVSRLPAARRPTCNWPPRFASGCWAGMRGMRRTANSGSLTSTFFVGCGDPRQRPDRAVSWRSPSF